MYSAYLSDGAPFVYVALIDDVDTLAEYRLDNDLNLSAFPTTYFDGGNYVYVGGSASPAVYQGRVNNVTQREAPDLDMISEITWIGDGVIDITVTIGNGVIVNDAPPPPVPELAELVVAQGATVYVLATVVDPDGDDLYYQFDWGDGVISSWYGPWPSGDTADTYFHSWTDAITYDIKVRAKDKYNGISDWSAPVQLRVSCCKSYTGNVDGDPIEMVDIGDLTRLIDYLFITYSPLSCFDEANIDGEGLVDIGDLTALIDYLFISYSLMARCE